MARRFFFDVAHIAQQMPNMHPHGGVNGHTAHARAG